MKKKIPLLLALVFALVAAGCTPPAQTPRLSIDNVQTEIAYSPAGARLTLSVTVSRLEGAPVYDIVPAVEGVTVDAEGTVAIAASVPDGVRFTARVRVGDYTAIRDFVYGTPNERADDSGVVKKLVKGRGESVTVHLPASYLGGAPTVYNGYGDVVPAYLYTLNGTRFTLSPDYLARLGGEGKVIVKLGDQRFEIILSVFDAEISTPAEFAAIGANAETLSRSYLLTADLDFYEFNLTSVMPQIGTYSDAGTTALTGTIDGDGHVLRNVVLNSGTNGGLFGHIAGSGVVRNLGVADSTFTVGRFGGMFAGYVQGTIENCFIRASVLSGSAACGFLGKEDSARLIRNCYVEFYADGPVGAGFAQYSKTALTNCFAWSNVDLPLLLDGTRGGDVTTSGMLTRAELTSAATYRAYPRDVFTIADGALPAYRTGTEGTQTAITIHNDARQTRNFRVAAGFDRGYAPIVFSLVGAPAGVTIDPAAGIVDLTAAPLDTEFTVAASAGSLRTEKTFTRI